MLQVKRIGDRRTSVDVVFDALYEEIVSLRLLPGDKLSEADVASRFGVSRQPVRDAFSRLENRDLLLIRPQKATEVKRFSFTAITKSRFVRAAVESEVLRRAAVECDEAGSALIDSCLEKQRIVVQENNYEGFGALDYEFHKTLCEVAKVDFAFDIISTEKANVDRLCMLSLAKEDRMSQLLSDHEAIADCVKNGNAEEAVEVGLFHLSRLDATIETIRVKNADYFDP